MHNDYLKYASSQMTLWWQRKCADFLGFVTLSVPLFDKSNNNMLMRELRTAFLSLNRASLIFVQFNVMLACTWVTVDFVWNG